MCNFKRAVQQLKPEWLRRARIFETDRRSQTTTPQFVTDLDRQWAYDSVAAATTQKLITIQDSRVQAINLRPYSQIFK